ncbi:MAG: hypothetical protein LBG19_12850 [Prevotellaceae bacterium]|nr:hypothetical protein [Prevotellaceae bacterium]
MKTRLQLTLTNRISLPFLGLRQIPFFLISKNKVMKKFVVGVDASKEKPDGCLLDSGARKLVHRDEGKSADYRQPYPPEEGN